MNKNQMSNEKKTEVNIQGSHLRIVSMRNWEQIGGSTWECQRRRHSQLIKIEILAIYNVVQINKIIINYFREWENIFTVVRISGVVSSSIRDLFSTIVDQFIAQYFQLKKYSVCYHFFTERTKHSMITSGKHVFYDITMIVFTKAYILIFSSFFLFPSFPRLPLDLRIFLTRTWTFVSNIICSHFLNSEQKFTA